MSKLHLTHHLYKAFARRGEKISDINRVVCAKDETARFIAVIENDESARLVNSAPSLGLTPQKRYRLSVDAPATVSGIGYVKDNNAVKVSDIIMTGAAVDYSGDELVLAAVDVDMRGVKKGEHKAVVRLYESVNLNDEKCVDEKTVTIVVRDCRLPQDIGMYIDLWQHNSNVARTYNVNLWSEEHFQKIALVAKKLSDIGQKSVTVVASDCPWRGWGCYLLRDTPSNLFEYNIVRVTRDKSGAFAYDFTALDKLIALYSECGIDGDITVYGLLGIWKMPYFDTAKVDYPEAVKVGYTDCDGCYKYMTEREQIVDYVRALTEHFKETGVWHKVRIGADEPSDITAFNENLTVLKSIAPDLKLKIAIDNPDIVKSIGNRCEDVCLSFPCTTENYRSEFKASRKLWYVCNVPERPNTSLDNRLFEAAALGVLNQVFGFDGLLRWAFTCWTNEPLRDIRYNVNGLPAGDTCLVYPSKDGGVWESIRYRALKFGIMLNELLARVKDRKTYEKLLSTVVGEGEKFYNIVGGLGISTDENDYLDLYDKLLEYFEKKGGAL